MEQLVYIFPIIVISLLFGFYVFKTEKLIKELILAIKAKDVYEYTQSNKEPEEDSEIEALKNEFVSTDQADDNTWSKMIKRQLDREDTPNEDEEIL